MKSKFYVILVIVGWLACKTEEYSHFNPNRRPMLMGDILPLKIISPVRERVQKKIVMYHNYFRAKVKPLATNMLKMKWHKGAAKAAQKWSEKCQFLTHDSVIGRHVAGYGACGQNIFIANKKVPWLFAIKTWWLEKDEFSYGKKNNLSIVGHYTQLVWAATHEVGCGLTECHYKYEKMNNVTKTVTSEKKVYYSYICNYCPIGNRPGKVRHPYKKGNPCSGCKKNCSRKLCLNYCSAVNIWANCDYIYKVHPHWLCNTQTVKGRERITFCEATCTCRHQIHD